MQQTCPAPEPEGPNLIPDGRDLGPEIVFLPPATWGRHLPPEVNALGQHVVLSLPHGLIPLSAFNARSLPSVSPMSGTG